MISRALIVLLSIVLLIATHFQSGDHTEQAPANYGANCFRNGPDHVYKNKALTFDPCRIQYANSFKSI